MSLYIYNGLSGVSPNYHSGGSVIIITDRDPNLVWTEYATEFAANKYAYEDDLDIDATKGNLTRMYHLSEDTEEKVFVFPNAGCC